MDVPMDLDLTRVVQALSAAEEQGIPIFTHITGDGGAEAESSVPAVAAYGRGNLPPCYDYHVEERRRIEQLEGQLSEAWARERALKGRYEAVKDELARLRREMVGMVGSRESVDARWQSRVTDLEGEADARAREGVARERSVCEQDRKELRAAIAKLESELSASRAEAAELRLRTRKQDRAVAVSGEWERERVQLMATHRAELKRVHDEAAACRMEAERWRKEAEELKRRPKPSLRRPRSAPAVSADMQRVLREKDSVIEGLRGQIALLEAKLAEERRRVSVRPSVVDIRL